MRKYLFAGAAALAIATPAAATTDNSGYAGIEGGIMWPKTQHVKGQVVFTTTGTPGPVNFTQTTIGNYRFKRGLDLDFVGGYDFGMFRVEGEFGYKHARAKTFSPSTAFVTAINTGAGTTFTTTNDFGVPRSTSVYSAMLNGLLDLGGNGSFGGYAGAGVGYASVHQFGGSKGKLAWQFIAGAYAPIGGNIDIGLKYRYFHAGSNKASRSYAIAVPTGATCGGATPFACSAGTATFYDTSRFTSNSLLASLIYSFGVSAPAPAPEVAPPPPPPEAPATQTCPDGSVILATSTCPVPPPPPPPPPAPTERGERGQ